MNLKAIKRVSDGAYLEGGWGDSFVADSDLAYRYRYEDDAIARAEEFDAGHVEVVDLDDDDRVLWSAS